MLIKNTKDVSSERLVALIVGPSGIGKTSLVKTLDPKETLIISAESGLLCLNGLNYDVFEITKMAQLEEVFEFLDKKTKYKNIFIDSITEISQMLVSELEKDIRFKDPKMKLAMWGAYNTNMMMILKAFRDLKPYTVFFTCLDKYEKDGLEMVQEFNLQGSSVKASIKGLFDIVLSYKVYKEEDGSHTRKLVTDMAESVLAKDRSGKLDTYEDPDLSAIKHKILGA